MPKKKSAQPSGATFEQSLEQLQEIVHQLEDGHLGLDESLARYEAGIAHLKRCYELLQNAERKIELLSGFDAEGNAVTRPLDDTETALGQAGARSRARRRSDPSDPAPSNTQDDVDEQKGLF